MWPLILTRYMVMTGLLKNNYVHNDITLEALCLQAKTLAKAGCDIVAPSDMMDGRIKTIREMLEAESFPNVAILSYAAKYASVFYGPFREAVGSIKALGGASKKTYQMDYANSNEALREVSLDLHEGADLVMVKPGLPYLDVVQRVSQAYNIPVFVYQVSGEYAMIKAVSAQGWMDEKALWLETMMAFKRAGASAVFTYAALEIASLLL